MFLRGFLSAHLIPHYFRRLSTIFAPATAVSRAGVAVIRVSGPDALSASSRLVKSVFRKDVVLRHRKLTHCAIIDPETCELLDVSSMAVFFAAPHSFTGEDVLELHTHGSVAVVNDVMSALGKLEGLRIAEPGEFTRRSLLNGKLDIAQVAGLSDLISSETSAQRRLAVAQITNGEGVSNKLFDLWRTELKYAIASFEALINFGEDDLSQDHEVLLTEVGRVKSLCLRMQNHLDSSMRCERLRDGIRVLILGRPNVGKSSLLNILTGRHAAIVSPTSGTTRDVLDVALDIGGYPVLLCDTAGMREECTDPIEAEGIRRAKERLQQADVVLLVMDGSESSTVNFERELCALRGDLRSTARVINVLNKSDLFIGDDGDLPSGSDCSCVRISCVTSDGIGELLSKLSTVVESEFQSEDVQSAAATRNRERIIILNAVNALNQFLTHDHSSDLALGAEHLRAACFALGQLTEHIGIEEVLDSLFSTFCVGK